MIYLELQFMIIILCNIYLIYRGETAPLKKPMVSLNLPRLNSGLLCKPPVNIRGF